jgi:hypothetical protein
LNTSKLDILVDPHDIPPVWEEGPGLGKNPRAQNFSITGLDPRADPTGSKAVFDKMKSDPYSFSDNAEAERRSSDHGPLSELQAGPRTGLQ